MICLESIQVNKDYHIMKEQYEEILREKEMLINQIENQPLIHNQEQDTQTIGKHLIKNESIYNSIGPFLESTNSNLLEQETEMVRLTFEFSLKTSSFYFLVSISTKSYFTHHST